MTGWPNNNNKNNRNKLIDYTGTYDDLLLLFNNDVSISKNAERVILKYKYSDENKQTPKEIVKQYAIDLQKAAELSHMHHTDTDDRVSRRERRAKFL